MGVDINEYLKPLFIFCKILGVWPSVEAKYIILNFLCGVSIHTFLCYSFYENRSKNVSYPKITPAITFMDDLCS